MLPTTQLDAIINQIDGEESKEVSADSHRSHEPGWNWEVHIGDEVDVEHDGCGREVSPSHKDATS